MARTAFMHKRRRQEAAAEIERLGSNSPINHIRKATFGLIEVRENGSAKKRFLLDVYFDKTSEDAARGVISAIRQQTWLTRFLIDKSILHESKVENLEIAATKQRLARDALLSDHAHLQAAHICCRMLPEIQQAYEAHYPSSRPIRTLVPFEWKREFDAIRPGVERAAARQMAAQRRRTGGSEVGYRRPPVHTRWQSGQSGNPSGAARATSDPWDAHRKAMMKLIGVSSGGRTRKATAIAVAVRQLFTAAMHGVCGAHQQVRELLIMLDGLGLLSPPPKARRRPRLTVGQKADLAARQKHAWSLLLPTVKTRLLEEHQRVYGPIPPFDTTLERQLADRPVASAPSAQIRTRSRPSAPAVTTPPVHPRPHPPRARTRTRLGGQSDD
ncbi:DUF5681 domain-containing protein [Methylobacterium sp. J-076]|uniref:DUF5681 domain-containing protein n=1 Tax=Methylobacterium sp. J-076 TaxID=2836655 RepID=UPI001FBBDD4E|nr:DUF5681 domain-containing protein [Methylobacterium sp. J-076]MCJ2010962.1 DUF5681 domain-containing protein [Methylobacterium sp. J-076]